MMSWHAEGSYEPALGEKISVSIEKKKLICFDAATGLRL